MADNAHKYYYIRVRGRVLGPFDVDQLRNLRARGQFGRANEVSTDLQTWQSAATVEHLFGGSATSRTRSTPDEAAGAKSNTSSPPSRSMTPVWYYAVGDEQCGPVTLLELRSMVASSQLTSDDFIWKEGMPDWLPIHESPEVYSAAKLKAIAPASQTSPSSYAPQVFCYACGSPTDARAEVCPKCGVRQRLHAETSEKNRMTAALLAFFLGGLGVHHFYLGNTAQGVIYLLFCWTLIPAIISFIEFIVFLCMSDASFAAKYARR